MNDALNYRAHTGRRSHSSFKLLRFARSAARAGHGVGIGRGQRQPNRWRFVILAKVPNRSCWRRTPETRPCERCCRGRPAGSVRRVAPGAPVRLLRWGRTSAPQREGPLSAERVFDCRDHHHHNRRRPLADRGCSLIRKLDTVRNARLSLRSGATERSFQVV